MRLFCFITCFDVFLFSVVWVVLCFFLFRDGVGRLLVLFVAFLAFIFGGEGFGTKSSSKDVQLKKNRRINCFRWGRDKEQAVSLFMPAMVKPPGTPRSFFYSVGQEIL